MRTRVSWSAESTRRCSHSPWSDCEYRNPKVTPLYILTSRIASPPLQPSASTSTSAASKLVAESIASTISTLKPVQKQHVAHSPTKRKVTAQAASTRPAKVRCGKISPDHQWAHTASRATKYSRVRAMPYRRISSTTIPSIMGATRTKSADNPTAWFYALHYLSRIRRAFYEREVLMGVPGWSSLHT